MIYGGVGQSSQVRALKNGVDVLVATPGRLIDLENQGLYKQIKNQFKLNMTSKTILISQKFFKFLFFSFIYLYILIGIVNFYLE